jgi:hypothetical protein
MNSTSGFLGNILNWAKTPFKTQGSALNWILFVGLLVIAAWFWQVILLKIEGEL